MATASSNHGANIPMPLRKKIGYAAAALIGLAGLWFALNFAHIKSQAKLGASYGAHIACSCRYIEGRQLASCESDFEPGMEMVRLSADDENQRIRASIPLLAEAYAERRGSFGCLQLNQAEIDAID
ncbi:MAG: hypothetical protein RSE16_09285 [Sphingobium sp.]|nr:MAG: hypothetical protein RSE16_09285 [Sphingobium sp.]